MNNRNIDSSPTQLGLELAGTVHQALILASFDNISSVDNLFSAWQRFRRGKQSRPDVLAFERNLEDNLFGLHAALKNRSYRHGSYEPFTICDPKQRQIHKATVRDRVVHQLLVSAIEPLFDRHFIYDSYSCRKHKGTHAAVDRLRTFLRKASSNNTKTVYALKLDVHKFFASVDHETLTKLLKKRLQDPQILWLLDKVIESHKVTPGKGMPLGNLTSQLFANVYMHELDWFVKNQLKVKYYLRYCDDFIIADTDRDKLLGLVGPLSEFLNESLDLHIHPQKISLRSWNQGVDFLGYVSKPHCTLLRTKTRKRMLAKVDSHNLPSYLGLCSHANAYRLKRLILNKTSLRGYEEGALHLTA